MGAPRTVMGETTSRCGRTDFGRNDLLVGAPRTVVGETTSRCGRNDRIPLAISPTVQIYKVFHPCIHGHVSI
ncbi:hypothetical protein E2C01_063143 [Portunus trituberculatus]|uniref:Uncharacterized protein n=1 Tax=Portunus trituberculatus TaxID=210409 RepID=A0A5B7HCX9_PORTR|nr:hypothetical protein [Portunus trituberculatus]